MRAATILVTGGFGYVGGRVVEHLSRLGYQVRAGTRSPKARRDLIPSAQAVHCDLLDQESLATACTGVEAVVHLAAPNEIVSGAMPEQAWEETVVGTVKLVRAACEARVRRIIYVSTAHVYGAPLTGRITERALTRPVHPYSMTHRAAEDVVLALNGGAQPLGFAVRLSNSVGAPSWVGVDRWSLVGNDLARQAERDASLTLKSSGTQVRDFVPIVDVAHALAHLLTLPETTAERLFNLGGEHSLSIRAFANLVQERYKELFGVSIPLHAPAVQPGDAAQELEFNIQLLKDSGYRATSTLAAAVDETLLFCRAAFGKGV